MGGKAKSPDPVATSTAQEHANQINTSNPFALTSYSQTGTNADGTPIETASTTMAPELQSLYGQIGQPNPALSPYALGDQFSQNQGAAYDQQMQYLQPQEQQRTAQLQDQLQQQGITEESNPTAYNNAMTLNNNNQTFQNQQAYDGSYQTGLNAENQQFNQGLQESNLPISQLSTLYGLGSGASMGSSNTLAQLAQQQYQSQLASQNNTDSGLAQLGSDGIMAYAMYAGAAASDIRLKKDIEKLGTRPDGIGVYQFRYLWDHDDSTPRVGVMAHEVEQVLPHAVITMPSGYKAVYYQAL